MLLAHDGQSVYIIVNEEKIPVASQEIVVISPSVKISPPFGLVTLNVGVDETKVGVGVGVEEDVIYGLAVGVAVDVIEVEVADGVLVGNIEVFGFVVGSLEVTTVGKGDDTTSFFNLSLSNLPEMPKVTIKNKIKKIIGAKPNSVFLSKAISSTSSPRTIRSTYTF